MSVMLNESEIKGLKGLSEEEAAQRLKEHGYNELPAAKKKNFINIVAEVLKEPMFILLIACGTLYLILGDIQEAMLLLVFVFVIIGITVYQENKTENALSALRDMSSPRALVIRGGEQKRIAGREVVPGDTIILREGDRVPADAVLLWELSLSVDESLLTGESVPVTKATASADTEVGRPGGDAQPCMYSGTLVVRGEGIAVVKLTGTLTEMGKIGKAIQSIENEDTPLQKETGNIVKTVSFIGLFLCLIVIVAYGSIRGDWMHGFLAGITLAMSILPEEFPVILTIFLAIGAWRMSQKRVLTRQSRAVETFGAASVLCVDKTGTLTQNKMSVRQLYAVKAETGKLLSSCYGKGQYIGVEEDSGQDLPEYFHELVEYAVLASKKDPFDPMERSLAKIGDLKLGRTEHIHSAWELVKEYPISRKLLALSHVWAAEKGSDYIIAAKGAPEAIADLCHFSGEAVSDLHKCVIKMADEGLRVLGIARSLVSKSELPEEQHALKFEFLGLIGFLDPIRPTVPAAVKEAQAAGIKIVMITGDYPGTAVDVARKIGLKDPDDMMTGMELDSISEEELNKRIEDITVFSRVVPEQKLRIVNAFKAKGHIVAMTGDGVNDAPALKAAHIGIAMGERGTDVAREASSIVVLDDDFTSIVAGVRMGRRIFDNLKKAMGYTFAVHVPIAGLSLIPVLMNWPLILLPVHIVFMELIIDPACSIVFEAEGEDPGIMERPPRGRDEHLFTRRSLMMNLMLGGSVLLITLAAYGLMLARGESIEAARALAFSTLVIANLGLILANRSSSMTVFQTFRRPNPALWIVIVGAVTFLAIAVYVPFFSKLFGFVPMHFMDVIAAFAAGLLSILWFELIKVFHN